MKRRIEVEKAKPWVKSVSEDALLVTTLDSFDLWLPKEDKSLTPSIMYNGFWESWITVWFQENIDKGDVVLDIGANCGYFTMLFEQLVGNKGQVTAYEANPMYVNLLQRTRSANNARFMVRPYAVSDSIGEIDLHVPSDLLGSASIVADWKESDKYTDSYMSVPTTTLDADYEADEFWMPDLVKMDVEGAEELVWDGGHSLWDSRYPPVVVLEYTPNAYSKDFNNKLFDYGDVTRITETGDEQDITKSHLDNLTDWDMLVVRRK